MKKANLFSLQVAVREDGRLAFDYDYVKPDVFIKTLNEMYPEFENTYTLASIVRLCIDNSEYLSSELIKLGRVT
jgi:hypothetical protein|tara:strand:+ start:191 stop:412 length:222 start_codon:yes stop_codon:yes gene_type:complete